MEPSFLEQLPYYIIAIVMLSGAIWTVTSTNILHAAIGLISTFSATAILYLLLNAEFVALSQVMVYIGGVLIFTIYTILLTTRLGDQHFPSPWLRIFSSFILSGGVFSIFGRVIFLDSSLLHQYLPSNENYASLMAIGSRLLSAKQNGYIIPFEVISILLLSSMIGAIVITRRPGESDPSESEDHV